MRNAGQRVAVIVYGAMALGAGVEGVACDPSTPQTGTGPADAGADRIILMAASGGTSCGVVTGTGGSPSTAPPGDGPGGSGGAGTGGAPGGAMGSAGRGGAPASGGGGRVGMGGAASGHGGVAGSSGGAGGRTGGGGASGAGSGPGGASGGRGGSISAMGGAAATSGAGGAGGTAAGVGGAAALGGAPGAGGGGIGAAGGAGGAAAVAPPPTAGELAIVELLINPAGTDTGREWIEVVNRAGHPLDLASLHIADAANDAPVDFTSSGTTVLLPGGRAVLIQSADPTKNGGITLGPGSGIFGGSFGTRVSLNNDADTITVCAGPCSGGAIVDQLGWDASLGSAYDDHAVSIDDGGRRCPAGTPFGDAGSFGTPGVENPPCP